jgi:CRISPR-associated protein Cmr3
VRAQFVRDSHDVDRVHALRLLQEVRIEGPWLVHLDDRDTVTPWVFAPADARREQEPDPALPSGPDPETWKHLLHRDNLVDIEEGQGTLWPPGAPPIETVMVPKAKVDKRKTTSPFPFWPLAEAIDWALMSSTPTHDPGLPRPIKEEGRVHVSVNDKTGTAEPGMLFSSAGGRFREGFGLLVRVSAPDFTGPGPRWPAGPDMVVLGGEARPSFRTVLPANAYPSYDRPRYAAALAAWPDRPGLRLQLLTHACLYPPGAAVGTLACLPSWLKDGEGAHPHAPGLRLRLRALRMERPVPVSGWDLQGGKKRTREGIPRQVRRLVPAGTVYYFDLLEGRGWREELALACEKLFAAPFDPAGQPDVEQHRPHPIHDGMGLCLPGLFVRG